MSETRSIFVKEFIITDKFGVKHSAIIAGVLDVSKFDEYLETSKVTSIKGKTINTITSWVEQVVSKEFKIGLSITNPSDAYIYAEGLRIAEGRALKPKKCIGSIISESRSMLGTEMCYSILDQQIDFIINNPGLFFKGEKEPIAKPMLPPLEGTIPFINPT